VERFFTGAGGGALHFDVEVERVGLPEIGDGNGIVEEPIEQGFIVVEICEI
jgi:hypothetical protein